MCRSFFTFTLVLLGAGALALDAAPVDPQGVFDNQIAGIGITDVDPFSITANANGGGVFNFRNVSGNNWVGMDLSVTLPQGESFTCRGGPFFDSCGVVSETPIPGTNLVLYDIGFGDPLNGGIHNNGVFSVNLNDPLEGGEPNLDPNGSGGWGANTVVGALQTDAVPEPATWVLLAVGIAALAGVRRLRLRAQHKL